MPLCYRPRPLAFALFSLIRTLSLYLWLAGWHMFGLGGGSVGRLPEMFWFALHRKRDQSSAEKRHPLVMKWSHDKHINARRGKKEACSRKTSSWRGLFGSAIEFRNIIWVILKWLTKMDADVIDGGAARAVRDRLAIHWIFLCSLGQRVTKCDDAQARTINNHLRWVRNYLPVRYCIALGWTIYFGGIDVRTWLGDRRTPDHCETGSVRFCFANNVFDQLIINNS